jgi:hypothetical protein
MATALLATLRCSHGIRATAERWMALDATAGGAIRADQHMQCTKRHPSPIPKWVEPPTTLRVAEWTAATGSGSSIRRLTMGRGLLLWLIGIPLPIILLIWLFGGLS